MKAATTLIVLALAAAAVVSWRNSAERHEPYSSTAPPLPARAAQQHTPAAAPTADDAHRRNDMLALGIERALVSRNPAERESAFTRLLPQLLQLEPARVTAMVARQEPGDARDTLRTEVARLWIKRDRDAAITWLNTLDGPERRAGAVSAVETLAASAPDQAIHVADQFDLGRDDGYLEHLVQIWATENLDAAESWIATQPPGPKSDPLRARIALVREQTAAARAAGS